MKKINLNDYVYVELTDYGWKTLTCYYEKLFNEGYAFVKQPYKIEDYVNTYKRETALYTIDGVERALTGFQLNDFMQKFGDRCYLGGENIIVGNDVYFEEDLKKHPPHSRDFSRE